jgi:sterol 24-C-methyltransferase
VDSRLIHRSADFLIVFHHSYYDLVTDFYEEAWAQSFHFCRFAPGESFLQSLARHEHYLAHRIGIDSSMTVLDVGCGVGKPARQLATFTGCKVVGLNNNAYQVERATAHAVREKLEERVGFVGGDFMVSFFIDRCSGCCRQETN